MATTDRSRQHCQVWLGAMLFRLAWRTTPQQLRDKTLISYGLDAGVPSAMVRFLRGYSDNPKSRASEPSDSPRAHGHRAMALFSAPPPGIPQMLPMAAGYSIINAMIGAAQAQTNAFLLLLSETMVGSARSKRRDGES